ncbi:MAG: coproporphyrinogen III oxidase, partial [Mariprofundus sp.]
MIEQFRPELQPNHIPIRFQTNVLIKRQIGNFHETDYTPYARTVEPRPVTARVIRMNRQVNASSAQAARALELVNGLQQRFVSGLEQLSVDDGHSETFTAVEWLRDGGRHGGGTRYEIADSTLFGRGSVNVSQVHYDDQPEKQLGSATAISTIIHPTHPLAPSVHIHISRTEMKNGKGYWRIMADLNPSHGNRDDTSRFLTALKQVKPDHFDSATAQGDRYFYIPALNRHRGVAHFYLENYHTDDTDADFTL